MDGLCRGPRTPPLPYGQQGRHQSSKLACGVHGTYIKAHFHPSTFLPSLSGVCVCGGGGLTREVEYLDILKPQSDFK